MNTVGQLYVQGQQAAVTIPLYDPRSVRTDRLRFRRDTIPMLDRANSLYVPVGRWPTRGWLLLRRGDYDQLNAYGTNLQLDISDTSRPDNVNSMSNLAIVQARCVTRGLASDPNALYLVEVTDGRGILYNEWFQAPTTSIYNIRAPAYPQMFHTTSMNGGTTWTWETMLSNLWSQMVTQLGGSWPGFPSGFLAPSGIPEGFWFPGVPVWYALNDILEYLGLTVDCDLTRSQPFTVVRPGDVDNAFTALQLRYASNLEDDLEWIDNGAGRVPKTVQVLFRRRNDQYGSEETVTRDSAVYHQWSMNPYYIVTINSPFTSAVGNHYIWSDFTVRYDMDNNALPDDVVLANTIATERVGQYFAKVYRQTSGYMTQVYAGALPFTTGPQVDGVCWYQDYNSQDWGGWRTKIVRGPYPPFEGIWS
jgi:hypothetical protein